MVKSRDSQAGSGQDMLAVRQISDDRIERIALRLALDSGSLALIVVGIFLIRRHLSRSHSATSDVHLSRTRKERGSHGGAYLPAV